MMIVDSSELEGGEGRVLCGAGLAFRILSMILGFGMVLE